MVLRLHGGKCGSRSHGLVAARLVRIEVWCLQLLIYLSWRFMGFMDHFLVGWESQSHA